MSPEEDYHNKARAEALRCIREAEEIAAVALDLTHLDLNRLPPELGRSPRDRDRAKILTEKLYVTPDNVTGRPNRELLVCKFPAYYWVCRLDCEIKRSDIESGKNAITKEASLPMPCSLRAVLRLFWVIAHFCGSCSRVTTSRALNPQRNKSGFS
jgi:hypothetical protein